MIASSIEADEFWMRQALAEACKGLGKTSPNPAVGAVLVRQGERIGGGYHHGAGLPHAEIEAFNSVEPSLLSASVTLYVTLEPCSTHGRTPPCVEAILNSGIGRVVVGAIDPNPKHAGAGLQMLQRGGLTVTSGILEKECARLNVAFNRWITTGRPWVIAKAAMTLDGRITRSPGNPQWISSEASRRNAHLLRAQVDAILVGAETLRKDNPRLTVRGVPEARQPWRVVLTRSGDLPQEAHLFRDEFANRTLVFQNRPLAKVLQELGERQITSVLIEGGGQVLGEAFDAKLVDSVHWYIAPWLVGGQKMAVAGLGVGANEEAILVDEISYQVLDEDIFASGFVRYPDS